MTELTHLNDQGEAQMVDVADKDQTDRIARAQVWVRMKPATLALIENAGHKKGDVLAVARIAGIQAAKKCSDLIPLCHPLALTKVQVDFSLDHQASAVRVETMCRLRGRTGVEMEALTAASIAALTIYDMCKAVDKEMVIDGLKVVEKRGGRSGDWQVDL